VNSLRRRWRRWIWNAH